jgi:hypothetical protein
VLEWKQLLRGSPGSQDRMEGSGTDRSKDPDMPGVGGSHLLS